MVKIEHLDPQTVATVVRNGTEHKLFLHQLITREELETLTVASGKVVYSVDELEIFEKSAPAVEPTPAKLSAKEIAQQAKAKAAKAA